MAAAMPQTPSSAGLRTGGQTERVLDFPRIAQDEAIGEIVRQLSV